MTQRSINNTIRAVALGAAIAVAFTACDGTTGPTTQVTTPRTVHQLVLGTWVRDAGGGQPQYIQLLGDGTAAIWEETQSIPITGEDRDFDLTWQINEAAPFDLEIEGFGVWTYDPGSDVLLDGNGQTYHRTFRLPFIK